MSIKNRFQNRVQPVYDRVRPYLPRVEGSYRGYVARDDRLLDQTTERPHYKAGLVSELKAHAPDHDVCIIGFGRGISSMIAIEAGARSVVSYEAAESMIAIGLESFDLNGVSRDPLSVHHAIVGESVDVFGSADGATVVPPAEVDTREVLVLDCEGAELSILDGIEDPPEVAIVETHPDKGAPAASVEQLCHEMGMSSRRVEYEPGSDKSVVVAE